MFVKDRRINIPLILFILINKAASIHHSAHPLARQPDSILVDGFADLLVLAELGEREDLKA